ncbi:hypothetical protein ACO1O0_004324 [Amphichorda felina]
MDTLLLKPRRPVEEEVENWDDGDFMVDGDDITLRSASSTANASSRRRDSSSSRLSLRSEIDSWAGEEEKHVHIPGDDEKSTLDAISAAQSAGIPLPQNIPSSALMGGTIRRLGGRKLRKITQEDWESDLELPDATQGLRMRLKEQTEFPETLRQVSGGSAQGSPTKRAKSPFAQFQDDRRDSGRASFGSQVTPVNLDKFKDAEEDDDFLGDGCDTIKVSKRQTIKPISLITPPTPRKQEKEKQPEDDFEKDLELPSNGTLRLSTRRDIPKTPSWQADDLDWGEGSLGTRYGGTRRDTKSNRSSSASALSPSVSSSITAESEDETFDGLILPPGPVNFQDRLKQRRKSRSPERIPEEPSPPKKTASAEADRPGFLDGLDIGDGDVFNSSKLTLHRNIKVKDARPSSPARPKTAVSLTFSNKPSTRIPRLSHERAHSTSLEPVSESGGPIPQRARRPASRLGHSAQLSVASLPTPTTSSSGHQWSPPTPSNRRELGSKASTPSLRNEPTTTNAQLLKQKRSLPAIRALNPPPKPVAFRHDRPPSRTDSGRPHSGIRAKTPVERQRAIGSESPALTRKNPLPFLPAGASHTQSQHVASKSARQFRRHDSENSIDLRPISRTVSRSAIRSPSPHRYRVAADTWERLSRPKGKKNFGDGHELDGFDDLPTSKETETRFLKQPSSGNAKSALRNRSFQNIAPDRTSTPTPTWAHHMKSASTPHFARDTTASRIARETSLAHRSTSSTGGPLAQINAQRGTPLSSRVNVNTQQPTVRHKKPSKRPPQLKPHLISNLNSGKESKSEFLLVHWIDQILMANLVINGMFYNAETYRWEGNENALNLFDVAASTPTTTTAPLVNETRGTPPPRPALITQISATKGVQVVNGMVFDPETMCWLKLGPQQNTKSDTSDPLDKFDALDNDDDDVFKDIPDLESNAGDEEGKPGRASDMNDDWLVGEEFDVGPEFVRRQREEEDRWRKKCEKWAGRGVRDRETWRWTIRELVSQFGHLPL